MSASIDPASQSTSKSQSNSTSGSQPSSSGNTENLERNPLSIRTHVDEPVSFLETTRGEHETGYGPILEKSAADRLLLDVIHDGDVIPAELLVDNNNKPFAERDYFDAYHKERDWGASLVAKHLAKELGLGGFLNVNIARVVMDFGRFPGVTPPEAAHLDRRAINYPFAELLSHTQKKRVLEHYYDGISDAYEPYVSRTNIKIAIHTYDTHNESGTRRPPLSILTRSVGYQVLSEMPFGVFDPLYPDILGMFTADRILRDRLSLTLEKAGYSVEHNYPYLLPDGSVEVRSQVWSFFHHLRGAFEKAHPHTKREESYRAVWDMLADTNLRSSTSEALRSYLHFFRRVPPSKEEKFERSRQAYAAICRFLDEEGHDFIDAYRVDSQRSSSLGIEVRKDLVYEFDDEGRAVAPKDDAAREIAGVLAKALREYFETDRPSSVSPPTRKGD
ncbi:MAG: hypothetical protein GY822_10005 [Deltaproteobacteria bacterium]|nr:hypothetical protein [Deltaproteobacteria bacterium]